jgi:anti-sigma regulatory factor (Ser/Thr protein kinase)
MKFNAKLENLYPMLDIICKEAMAQHFDERNVGGIRVAAEEALVNVIHYAYGDGDGDIDLEISCNNGNFVIVIKDKGIAFDPLHDGKEADINSSLEDRPIGGLGRMMIKKYMDDVVYKRDNGYNIFTMIKKGGQV